MAAGSPHPFEDAGDGAGDEGFPAVRQQVKHHAQELLLHLLLPQRREEGLGDLEGSEVRRREVTDRAGARNRSHVRPIV